MGSKSNLKIMKTNRILKNKTVQKNQKKENAQDIISKSIQKICGKNTRPINNAYDKKIGFTAGHIMGSKSKTETMKSFRKHKKEAEQRLKNQKRENAQVNQF